MKAFRDILLLSLALGCAARAEFPLQPMGPRTLGIQYGLAFRGQNITAQDVPSHETIHAFTLGYSPIPYLGLEAGMALDQFAVDSYKSTRFRGDYGISPVLGLVLATPYLLEFARMTAGIRVLSLNSEDDQGFSYGGFIANPWVAALISPSAYVDFQFGARGHSIDGNMRAPGASRKTFSNRETLRGFASFTIKSPTESPFITFDFDCSPAFESDWSGGPRESSIGVSFGTLLGWKPKSVEPKEAPAYFPAYPELKERLKKMAEDIE